MPPQPAATQALQDAVDHLHDVAALVRPALLNPPAQDAAPLAQMFTEALATLDATSQQVIETMETLRQREERVRLLIDTVEDYAIFMLDPRGLVLSWNQGAQRIKGYAAAEIIGQHFARFYVPEDVAAGKPMTVLTIAAQWGHYSEEGWRLRNDGTCFWASVVITPLYDAHGTLQGFGKVTRDLTERKLAEEAVRQSEERFRLLIESVRDYAIFMLDSQGIITSWNTGAQLIKGYAAHEIVGQHFSLFYDPSEVAAGKPAEELVIAQHAGRYEEEGWRVRKDGSRFWANVVITPIRDAAGTLRGYSKVTRDLSERRWADEERTRLQRRELELALERVTRQQMEAAVAERDAFLAAAAHELRTPLTTLLGTAEHQLRRLTRLPQIPAPEQQRMATMVQQALRLRRLVNGLVDLTHLNQDHLELHRTPLDLTALVQTVADEVQPTLSMHTLTLQLPAEAVIVAGDRERLELILHHLLHNAVIYSPNGGQIGVALTVDPAGMRLTITDQGLGILPSDLPQIFARFYRGRHHDYQIPGMGIGLYLAHEVVTRHGGTIRITSRVNEGSQVQVRFPRDLLVGTARDVARGTVAGVDGEDPPAITRSVPALGQGHPCYHWPNGGIYPHAQAGTRSIHGG